MFERFVSWDMTEVREDSHMHASVHPLWIYGSMDQWNVGPRSYNRYQYNIAKAPCGS